MILKERSIKGGTQVLHKFPNGYGASVVQHDFSYGGDQGLWELAVIKYNGETYDDGQEVYHITYDTDITDDVLGYLTMDDVEATLIEIEALEEVK